MLQNSGFLRLVNCITMYQHIHIVSHFFGQLVIAFLNEVHSQYRQHNLSGHNKINLKKKL